MSKLSWKTIQVPLGNLKEWQKNPAQISERDAKQLARSLDKFGYIIPFVAAAPKNGKKELPLLDGHQRKAVELSLRHTDPKTLVDVRVPNRALTEKEKQEAVIRMRSNTGEYNPDALLNWFDGADLLDWGMPLKELEGFGFEFGDGGSDAEPRNTLVERFGVPPFSVLDARQGYWQSRKRAWSDLGILSEIGRDAFSSADARTFKGATQNTESNMTANNTPSIFDPVLCELAYLRFCPTFGQILDPFAGGSVRGIVAAHLGYHYIGVDLRPEQIAANEKQAKEITPDNTPVWMEGDSRNLSKMLNTEFDFVFSCPPYFDLELYSDNDKDLSNAGDYKKFLEGYRDIIKQSVSLLKDNRFACFVVGDIRDKKGFYRNFVGDTIAAFQDAGATLYNEAILVTPIGTVMMQTSRNFPKGRKLGKTHQNVLVFYKGNPKEIPNNYKEIEIVDLAEQYGEVS